MTQVLYLSDRDRREFSNASIMMWFSNHEKKFVFVVNAFLLQRVSRSQQAPTSLKEKTATKMGVIL